MAKKKFKLSTSTAAIIAILVIVFIIFFSTSGQTAQFISAKGPSSQTLKPVSCVDTDNGKNVNVAGNCTDRTKTYSDSCAVKPEKSGVAEYFCNNNACTWEFIECTGGKTCQGGKCVLIIQPSNISP